MDFDHLRAIKIPFAFIKKLGLWQDETSGLARRLNGIILHLVLIELATCCHSVHMIRLIMDGRIEDMLDVMSILFTVIAVVLKTIWLFTKTKKIKEMLEKLSLIVKFSSFGRVERPALSAMVKKVVKVEIFFYGSSFVVIILATISSLIHHKEKALPFNSWFFVDLEKPVLYWSTFAYQFLTSFYGISVNYSLDLIPMIFMSFVSTIFEELSEEIEKNCDRDDFEQLQKCIECHILLKKLAKDVSKHLTFPFFAQASLSSIILCATTFSLTTVS